MLSLFPLSVRAQDYTTGLVAHWKLDETGGTTAVDSAGSYDGTMANGLSGANSVLGQVGRALHFDGTNDAITIPHDPALAPGTSDWTTAVWFKTPTINTDGSIFRKRNSSSPYNQWHIRTGSIQADGTVTTSKKISLVIIEDFNSASYWFGRTQDDVLDGEWHHIVAVRQGANAPQLYLDGELASMTTVGSAGVRPQNVNNTVNWEIGGGTGDVQEGPFDDVRMYNRALSAADIAALYASMAGSLRYNTSYRVAEYHDGADWVAMGKTIYVPTAVNFDGTNDWLSQGAPTGVADGKTATASVWVRRSATGTADFVYGTSTGFYFQVNSGGALQISGENPAAVNILDLRVTNAITTAGTWHHILVAVDMTDITKTHIYLDGVQQTPTVNVFVNDVLEFTETSHSVGAFSGGGNAFMGDIADLWVDFNNYIDISQAENRAKFVSSSLDPVYLGATGTLPTGSAPDVFLSGSFSSWHTNKGTAGGFTKNGAIGFSVGGPPGLGAPSNGLKAYLKLDETSGTAVADSTATIANGTWLGGAAVQSAGGVRNQAMDFAGDNDEVDLGTPTQLNFSGTDAFTVMGWAYPRDYGVFFARGGVNAGASDEVYFLDASFFNSGAWTARVSNGTTNLTTYANGSVELNAWQHVAMTWDGTNLTIYKNGASVATDSAAINLWNGDAVNDQETSIGADGRNERYYFNGLIDDVMVYNRALTQPEIEAIYEGLLCQNPERGEGTIIYNTTRDVMQFCNGEDWIAMGPVPGAGGAGCTSPAGAKGEMTFNTAGRIMQYCDGTDWVAVGKEPQLQCVGSPDAGEEGCLMPDGTVYAGLSPDGNVAMFTTPADAGSFAWNDGSANYIDTAMVNCTGYSPGSQASCETGEANTTFLVGLNGSGSPAPYQAAEHCDALSAHGHTDWYLPAQDELNLLYLNRWAIGGFNTSAVFNQGWYWSSTELANYAGRYQKFSDGVQDDHGKETAWLVRCVRK